MNQSTSTNYAPQESRNHIEALKKTFISTWNGTQRTLEFLVGTIEQQSQRIQYLESHAAELEREMGEKKDLISSFEARLFEVNRSFDGQLAQRQMQLDEVMNQNNRLEAGWRYAVSGVADIQKEMNQVNGKYKQTMLEMETLQEQLREAQSWRLAQGHEKSFSDSQMAAMQSALKKEMEERNNAVRKAAANVAKEAEKINIAFIASAARVSALEKVLQDNNIDPTTFQNNPHTQDLETIAHDTPRASTAPAAFNGIISGSYRPGPSLMTTTGGTNTANTQAASALMTASTALNPLHRDPLTDINSSEHPPASASNQFPSTSSTDVIDLTLSPVGTPERLPDGDVGLDPSLRPAKRQRVDSDALPPNGSSSRPGQLNPQQLLQTVGSTSSLSISKTREIYNRLLRAVPDTPNTWQCGLCMDEGVSEPTKWLRSAPFVIVSEHLRSHPTLSKYVP